MENENYYTEEDMRGAYGCGWADCVIYEAEADKDIMLKKYNEFLERLNNVKNYLKNRDSEPNKT